MAPNWGEAVIPMTLVEIAAAVGGEVIGPGQGDRVVSGEAFVDSRRAVADGLFVAVKGESLDGHDFAAAAVSQGAAAALVQRRVDVPAVLVPDAVPALGALARHVLKRLPALRVIGITGSSGKTGTKDILAQLLEQQALTVAPVGSLNNEIGVPLTALRATGDTRYLIVEMGARGRGHIRYLTSLVPPHGGVVLNVGIAHLGEFGTQEDIAASKGELVEALPPDGFAVLNADDPLVGAMRGRTSASVVTFGEASDADFRLSDVRLDEAGRPRFELTVNDVTIAVALQLVGAHQAANATAAAAAACRAGMSVEQVASELRRVRSRSPWRMEVTSTPAGLTVINDAYNANPDSMRAALETLAEIGSRRQPAARTIAVLGEMRELGAAADAEHKGVGRLAAQLGVSQLVVVGEAARGLHLGAEAAEHWEGSSIAVSDAEAAIELLRGAVRPGDVVLVKASRAARLEIVAAALVGHATKGDT